jgi:glycerol-3-phosphate acyltransferase PlsY
MIVVSYLIGGIPVGLLVGHARGVDLREVGSGNIGASNALRALGPGVGAAVWIADLLKGLLPTVWASWYLVHIASTPDRFPYLAAIGFAAVLGHCFSPYLRFKGGRGVSTTLGSLLALDWRAGVLAFAIWLLMLAFTRYISLSSITACCAIPFLMSALPREPAAAAALEPYIVFGICIAVLTTLRHYPNIRRLLSGTETKIGQRTEVPVVEGVPGGPESETEYR